MDVGSAASPGGHTWPLDMQSPPSEPDRLPILGTQSPSSPSGMMEMYFPRNLLAMVISCQRLQPCLENTWWAADGGWWLTWDQTSGCEHS